MLFFRYVNVILNGLQPGYRKFGLKGSVFLENPVGENILSFETLLKEVSTRRRGVRDGLLTGVTLGLLVNACSQIENLFGLYNQKIVFKDEFGNKIDKCSVDELHGRTIFVEPYYCQKFVKEGLSAAGDGILRK